MKLTAMHFKKIIPFMMLIIITGIIFTTGLYQYISFEKLQAHYLPIKFFVQEQFILASLIYIALYILVVALSLPGAAFMSITGGVLFGYVFGFINAIIGATLGSFIPFFSARLASRDVLEKRAGPWVNKMQKGFHNNALSYLLTLRLIPIFPFASINLVAALMQLPFKTFFLGTFFGTIPATLIFVSIGVAVQEVIVTTGVSCDLFMNYQIWGSLTGLAILALTPIIYKKFKKRESEDNRCRRL
jgi:uncharacterized membrane protein YdjX (TVP38/TMEM64 family)